MSSEERDDGDVAAPGGSDGGGSEEEPAAAGGGKRVLTARKLEKLQARAEKKGVVYLSRVPPFMKPVKLRHLLEQHGEVLRIYLAAEGAHPAQRLRSDSMARRKGARVLTPVALACADATARVRRKRSGGNSGKKFTEGCVCARRQAAALRRRPVTCLRFAAQLG